MQIRACPPIEKGQKRMTAKNEKKAKRNKHKEVEEAKTILFFFPCWGASKLVVFVVFVLFVSGVSDN